MSVEWIKGRGEVSSVQLDEFEEQYQISFPDDYKTIVSKYNGGYPSATLLDLPTGREVVFDSLINWDQSRKANIYFWMNCLGLSKTVPFGKDPFGNLFCFCFSNSSNPHIKYWDHETGEFHMISNNWKSFTESFHE